MCRNSRFVVPCFVQMRWQIFHLFLINLAHLRRIFHDLMTWTLREPLASRVILRRNCRSRLLRQASYSCQASHSLLHGVHGQSRGCRGHRTAQVRSKRLISNFCSECLDLGSSHCSVLALYCFQLKCLLWLTWSPQSHSRLQLTFPCQHWWIYPTSWSSK